MAHILSISTQFLISLKFTAYQYMYNIIYCLQCFYQYGLFLFMKVKRNLHSVDLKELHILFMNSDNSGCLWGEYWVSSFRNWLRFWKWTLTLLGVLSAPRFDFCRTIQFVVWLWTGSRLSGSYESVAHTPLSNTLSNGRKNLPLIHCSMINLYLRKTEHIWKLGIDIVCQYTYDILLHA